MKSSNIVEQAGGECAVCGGTTFNRCSGCPDANVFFCSKEHQKLLWHGHKFFCGGSPDICQFPPLSEAEYTALLPLGYGQYTPGLPAKGYEEWLRYGYCQHGWKTFLDSLRDPTHPAATPDWSSCACALRLHLQLHFIHPTAISPTDMPVEQLQALNNMLSTSSPKSFFQSPDVFRKLNQLYRHFLHLYAFGCFMQRGEDAPPPPALRKAHLVRGLEKVLAAVEEVDASEEVKAVLRFRMDEPAFEVSSAVLRFFAICRTGTEIVAIAAGKTKDPRRTLPRAIKNVYIRILLFYILGVFITGLLVPSNDPRLKLGTGTAVSAPFVIAIQNAGIKALPSVINAALLSSAWSAASSDLYTSSRALYGLALNGDAPKILTETNRWGLPWVTVLVGCAFALLSFMSVGSADAGKVFNWFANMTSVCGLITWAGICITHVKFRRGLKAQGIDRAILPYRPFGAVFLSYYALIFICIILFFNAWDVLYASGW